ncbi:hypothetical protein FB548_2181 [Pseudoxanthomonas sp. 3HH-4]|uniref:hypothetical protein n=1 Tax=Pseudoxanthomonas sp. 3HH-4 TaxID=1690214 RepID=UPI00114F2E84|nr:hypothetical protein [Pseudoxanthomonas sp. 3HH-4]TQM12250.1 hypothetical protein FB548_2181 [Pseudoxanthomonas sp. 3HH-4]
MKLTPTPIAAAIAGLFAGIVMPLIWPRLGDETLNWVFAFLLVVALPVHGLVVGFTPSREARAAGALDTALLKRVTIWLVAAVATVALMKILLA